MHFAVPREQPKPEASIARVKRGGYGVIVLFGVTIALTVVLHQWLHLPSFLGMMTGLGLLMIHGHFIRRRELLALRPFDVPHA